MDKDNFNEFLFKNTKLLNSKLNANYLDISLPQGFSDNLVSDPLSACVFVSKKDNFLVQFIVGGSAEDNSFDSLVQREVKQLGNVEYLEDFKSDLFEFKLFKQDIDGPSGVVRQLYAYFVDSKYKEFYQLSVAFGPCRLNDLKNKDEFVTNELLKLIKSILSDIKYVKRGDEQ